MVRRRTGAGKTPARRRRAGHRPTRPVGASFRTGAATTREASELVKYSGAPERASETVSI